MFDVAYSSEIADKKRKLKNLLALHSVGRLLNVRAGGVIDRTGAPHAYRFEATPIPALNVHPSFEEAMLRAAEDFWSSPGEKGVMWSGGIDSTSVLVALMRTNSQWANDLAIYTSDYSTQHEYPLFHSEFLLPANASIKNISAESFASAEMLADGQRVTDGNVGDQLWGCNTMETQVAMLHEPWEVLFSSKHYKESRPCEYTEEYIRNLVAVAPVPITTLAHLYWWMAFTHKFDQTRRRLMAYFPTACIRNYHPFFVHPLLQQWSIDTYDQNIEADWKSYKKEAKQFIFSFTGDAEYRDNKTQHPSMGHSVQYSKLDAYAFIDDAGNATKVRKPADQSLLRACLN